jgi:PAS domain S-box-containing protein
MVKSEAAKSNDAGQSRLELGIGTKITLLLCAVVGLATSAVGVTIYWQFNRALVGQELTALASLAQAKAALFTEEMKVLRSDAMLVASTPVVKQLVTEQLGGDVGAAAGSARPEQLRRVEDLFEQLLRAKPTYCQVRLIGVADGGREIVRVNWDPKRGELAIVPPAELQQKGNEKYFAEAVRLANGEVYLSEINLNREHGQVATPLTPVIRAATPVFGPQGKPLAIVVINSLFEPVAEGLRGGLSDNQTLLVTNERGDYLVHPAENRTFGFDRGQRQRIQDDFPVVAAAFNDGEPRAQSIVDRAQNGDRIAFGVDHAAFDPSRPSRFLTLAVASSYDEAVRESVQSRNRSLSAGAAVLLVALAAGYFVSRSVTEPLRQIVSGLQAFARGEADVQLPVKSRDETGIVARALSSMLSDVRSSHAKLKLRAEQLEQSRRGALNMLQDVESGRKKTERAEWTAREQSARTQAILDGATDAIITIRTDGAIESFNVAAERMFGYSANEVIGKNVNLLMPPPYHDEHDQYLRNYLETGISKIIGIGREVVGLRGDGSTFPMQLGVSEVKLGDRRMFTGIVRDITDLKQAMQQLTAANSELAKRSEQIEQYNINLKRSNEELKQFAYVASHDLQEPLRKVTAFCQMLRDDYGERLDDTARTYIQYAVDGALRMKTLMQDLLTYSRVETQGKPLEPTDAEDACAEAIDNLAVAIAESGAQVTHNALPVVSADRAQLVRLFQNLIGNAIKYRGERPPRIHVSAAELNDEWEFRISDNGIGIDPQYHERIFVIFQRLHGREEYSGTGIGLAVCKRIVERAGGKIWVESIEGAGSEFCFTLSKASSVSSQGAPSHDRRTSQIVSAVD